jgi:cytochrome c-type biogenesis protein
MGILVLSFAAGALSVLSPCVLPLLPVVLASALQQHRHAPLALGGGLVISSAGAGLFFASLGFAVGLDRDVVRAGAAALMAAAGVVLLSAKLQDRFAGLTAPIATSAAVLTRRVPPGLAGQFLLGAALGAVWTPCSGPTLAAAITLAARADDLARAAAVMLTFGIGAVVPVLWDRLA